MPFTPFHFGPSALVSLPLQKYIDVPVFVLANVVIDFEPLVVIVFDLKYQGHEYFHNFLIGSLVGILWGTAAYFGRGILKKIMRMLRLPYTASFRKMLISGVLGVWFHVIVDSIGYRDVKPFYPLDFNPMLGIMTRSTVYLFCMLSFIPAIMMVYVIRVLSLKRFPYKRRKRKFTYKDENIGE